MRIKDLATRATKLLTGNAYMVFDNGTKVEKVDYAELAKQIITEYNTQTLAGSAQSVKSALDALNSKMPNIAQDISNTLSAVNCTVERAYSARVGVVMFVALRFTTTEEIRRDMQFINGLPKAFSNYTGLQNIRLYDFTSGKCFDAYVSHSDGANTSGIFAVEDIPSGHQIRGTFSYIANI